MWTHFYLCQSRHHIWRQAGGWLPGPLLDRSRNFVPTLRVSQRTWSELNFSSRPTIYPAEKKVPTFLSVVGGTTYGLLRNLLAPASPKDKSFKEIVDTLKAHFEPKPLVIAERFHFHRQNQNSGESVAMYVAELRRLATHCAFEAYLEVALPKRGEPGYHRFQKIMPVLMHLKQKFLAAYNSHQQNAIDKAMIPFKGTRAPL